MLLLNPASTHPARLSNPTSLAIAFLLACGTVAAEQADAGFCYSGNQDNGELTFASAVEGSGFSGQFGAFEVRYCMPENQPERGEIHVRVETGSADTDNSDRDEALLGPEFFDVAQFPLSTWVSRSIQVSNEGYRADGELELRGIQAPVSIEYAITPDGDKLRVNGQFQMSGSAEINRQDFSVGTGEFADPEFVRNRVDVNFSVELTPGHSSGNFSSAN